MTFRVDQQRLEELEKNLGLRILMTDRHDWPTTDIIQAFYGQAHVERAFRNVKNPHHLAVRPQFHWTDQKIAVHHFMCVLGYLMAAILMREAKAKAQFTGGLDSLLDTLSGIRLAACITRTGKRGKPKVSYQLEELGDRQQHLAKALDILETHMRRPKIKRLQCIHIMTDLSYWR